jgi:hypothetical protein
MLDADPDHQRQLLATHLRRFLTVEENLTQRTDDVTLALDREHTLKQINALAASLGLNPLPAGLAAVVIAVGLRKEAITSLERQRERLTAYRRAAELQQVTASPSAQVSLKLALQQVDERLAEVGRQLDALCAEVPVGPSLPGNKEKSMPPLVLTSDQLRRLRELLKSCDELVSNDDLGALFADPRLQIWRFGVREATSIRARIDQLIDYLSDKRNTTGQHGLVLLLQTLAERYDTSDARHGELLALAGALAPPNAASQAPTGILGEPEVGGGGTGRRARLNLSVAEMKLAVSRAHAVAQVNITRTIDGVRRDVPTGTAWLIAPGLAITCWHVIEARRFSDRAAEPEDLVAQIGDCLLTFGYTDAAQGRDYAVAALEHAHQDASGLDYALLRLRDRTDAPLATYGLLPIELEPALTPLSELFVLQHPGGEAQQQADGTFERQVVGCPERIHYTNRTAGGASGAPVLNRTGWRVVALHHGSSPDDFGEGILLGAIMRDLAQQRPDLADAIRTAQQ